ncbi:MAG: sensor histidine kinase, partial [Planctomycetota bacterium]
MDPRDKSVLFFFITAALIIIIWFAVFPLRGGIRPGNLFFEGIYLIVAVGSFLLVQQLGVDKISWGWSLLTTGLLLGFLGEFAASPEWAELYLATALKSGGLVLMGTGFYSALMTTKAEKDKYRSLFHEMGDGIALNEILYDNAGMPIDYIFHEVNPAFESLCGVSRGEVQGKAASEVYDTDEVPLLDVYSVVTETLEPVGFITYFEPLDKHVHVSAFAIERGKFATVFSDISERMATEEKLRGARNELRMTREKLINQDWERTLNTMASGIVHDFNNALTTITGFTDLLLNRPEKLEDREMVLDYLRRMDDAAGNAAETVRRMHQLYQPHGDEEPRPLDLNKMIRDAISMTRPRWREEAQAHSVSLEIETDMPDVCFAKGRETELHEMVTHLILNAIDAMGNDGVIHISTREKGDQVELTVSDPG